MNRKKQVLAVMTSLCLLVIIGIKVPLWLAVPTMQHEEPSEETLTPEVVQTADVADVLEVIENESAQESVQPLETAETGIIPQPVEIPEAVIQKDHVETSEVTQLLDGVSDVDEQWVMRELEEHQDEIEQEDLEDGLAILDKIDANYLYDMSEGGFTEEEKAEAKAFLRAELPEEDVRIVWGLINKYMELVN